MKQILLCFVAVLSIVFLASCEAKLEGPKVKVYAPDLFEPAPSGNFCPPGQAKKGRC